MIDIQQAIAERHSVRSYTDRPIEQEKRDELQALVSELNAQSGLRMQLAFDDEGVFDRGMARYGKFENVRNYLAVVGLRGSALEETAGYFGEQVVLRAQQLGLNSCWVALTYSKKGVAASIPPGHKLVCVIALGYGTTQGIVRRSKAPEEVMEVTGNEQAPSWFAKGIEAALLAPTAMNQQKFTFELDGNIVKAKAGKAFYAKIDLGIAKLHFELGAGAGADNFRWA